MLTIPFSLDLICDLLICFNIIELLATALYGCNIWIYFYQYEKDPIVLTDNIAYKFLTVK